MSSNMALATTPTRGSKPQTPQKTPHKKSPSTSSIQGSPRNPENTLWTLERERKDYTKHLKQWGLDHDSSAQFQGQITICDPPSQSHGPKLGSSVKCVLSQVGYKDQPRRIVIRLFAPRHASEGGRYRMVIRSGSGWMNERQFFDKEYYRRQRSVPETAETLFEGSTSDTKSNAVTVRPLFFSFLQLPIELQQHILGFAVGKTSIFRLMGHNLGFGFGVPGHSEAHPKRCRKGAPKRQQAAPKLRLLTVFSICKSISAHMIPWIYSTTTFQFGHRGLTNFLYQSGPSKRRLIKKLRFSLKQYAVLHCMRWFAPDPIFDLYAPNLHFEHPGKQYSWRSDIQDLCREVHLRELTIDVSLYAQELELVTALLVHVFAGVERVKFVDEKGVRIHCPTGRLSKTWMELCEFPFNTSYRGYEIFWFFFVREWTFPRLQGIEMDRKHAALKDVMSENMEFFGRKPLEGVKGW